MISSRLKAQVRKHALRHKVVTADWTDEQLEAYAEEHGIKVAKSPNHVPAAPAPKPEPEVEDQPEPEPAPKVKLVAAEPSVDRAIKDLIDAMDLKGDSALDEPRVIELIEQHSRKVTVDVKNHETGEVRTIEGAHKDLPAVATCIAAGVNVAVVGPAGSGKSTAFEQIADSMGIDYYFTGAVQQEHKIMGFTDANGTYHRTQFRDAFENGGLFVMEEFDGSGARPMLAINNASANNWCDFPDGKIAKHKDFVLVMAGNTYGSGASRQYVGRQQLDGATLDRFAFIEFGYDEELERAITLAINPDAGSWVDKVQAFRAKVDEAGIRHIVSPRASIMGAKLLKQGMDVTMITKIVLHKGLSQDQLNQVR